MTQYHDPRTLGEAMCEIRVLREASREHNRVVKERDELRAALADRDAKLAALEKQEPVAWAARALRTAKFAYIWHEKDDVQGWINLQHQSNDDGTWRGPIALYAAAGAAPVPEGWRSAVAMAYGHLWHVNNEPMAPTPLRSEESASYAARKLLRDLMTTKERGEAINAVQKLLAAVPKEPS